jgi:hypothetical protein
MQVKITKDTLTPELKRLMGAVRNPLPLYQAGAKAVQVGISKHLKTLQQRGNKRGWPSQHFFAGSATAVEKNVGIASVSATGAMVTVADPRFVHRITGGVVKPKRRKYLAIPLRAEAYKMSGKGTLRESMPNLKVWKFKTGLFLVKETSEKRGKGKASRIRVLPMFKLVKSVTHSPHPEEMPKSAELGATAAEAMTKAAKILLRAR